MTQSSKDSGIVRFDARPSPTRRLLCFPYAGALAAHFRPLAGLLPPEIDVCVVDYAGHGSRGGRLATTIDEFVDDLAPRLTPLLDLPFSVLGYSLGAWIGFEWIRSLAASGNTLPSSLVVCAARAPHREPPLPRMTRMSDGAFLAELQNRYGAIPQAVLDEPELLAMLLPVVRSDMAALEAYEHQAGEPLPMPICAVGGAHDAIVSTEHITEWAAHTRAGFVREVIDGGHLFVRSHVKELGALVLRECLAHQQ
jgi:surfactin synthase thioesterase subunit